MKSNFASIFRIEVSRNENYWRRTIKKTCWLNKTLNRRHILINCVIFKCLKMKHSHGYFSLLVWRKSFNLTLFVEMLKKQSFSYTNCWSDAWTKLTDWKTATERHKTKQSLCEVTRVYVREWAQRALNRNLFVRYSIREH